METASVAKKRRVEIIDIDDIEIPFHNPDAPIHLIPADERPELVVGMDPGETNFAYCEMDVARRKVVHVEKLAFREKLRKDAPKEKFKGHGDMLANVGQFLSEKMPYWKQKRAMVFVEDQIAGRLDTKSGKSRFTKGGVSAVQWFIEGTLSSNGIGCRAIRPRDLKCHFREYFPSADEDGEQYSENKKWAVINGRQFMPGKFQFYIDQQDKKDDCYDAMWVAKYGLEMLEGRPSYSVRQKQKNSQARKNEKAKRRILDDEEKKTAPRPRSARGGTRGKGAHPVSKKGAVGEQAASSNGTLRTPKKRATRELTELHPTYEPPKDSPRPHEKLLSLDELLKEKAL